jgi:prolyl oligopeptidase
VQRPQVAEAVVVEAGILDMARFEKFTIGPSWIPEYGTAGDPAQLKDLLAYSPLQNVREGVRYPAFLLAAGENDDNVPPFHSYKFVATLQGAQSVSTPMLLRAEPKAGRTDRMPTQKVIGLAADRLTFLSAVLGVKR